LEKKAVSGIMLTLLSVSMLTFTLTFNIQPAKSDWIWTKTIYIRADGSVDPSTAPIHRDGDVYTLTDNITQPYSGDAIVIGRDNMTFDGAGYTIEGSGMRGCGTGITVSGRSNITIKNAIAKSWGCGIYVNEPSKNIIISMNKVANNEIGVLVRHSWPVSLSRNKITGNSYGIMLADFAGDIIQNEITDNGCGLRSWGDDWVRGAQIIENNIANNSQGILLLYAYSNNISGNIITGNSGDGIRLASSISGIGWGNGGNTIHGNNLTANGCGITLYSDGMYWDGAAMDTANNTISGNNIENNGWGLCLEGVYLDDMYGSISNPVYHNNFINNIQQVHVAKLGSACILDDGYPSGGNYWSDYTSRYPDAKELDDSGVWDTPYVIDANNRDRYPLMNPWGIPPPPPVIMATIDVDPDTLNLKSEGQWITAYIQLPEPYIAADINATTILFNGTISPILDPKYSFATNSSEYLVDPNNDGILERMVKFDRATMESFIYNQGITYGEVSLTMTGELFDGTPFEGTGVIFVNYAGDAKSDGIVNILDAAAVSAHWYPGPPIGSLGYDANADFNKDGAVNILDIGILSVNWGRTVP